MQRLASSTEKQNGLSSTQIATGTSRTTKLLDLELKPGQNSRNYAKRLPVALAEQERLLKLSKRPTQFSDFSDFFHNVTRLHSACKVVVTISEELEGT